MSCFSRPDRPQYFPCVRLDFRRDRALWHKTSRDDRSLALLAKTR